MNTDGVAALVFCRQRIERRHIAEGGYGACTCSSGLVVQIWRACIPAYLTA